MAGPAAAGSLCSSEESPVGAKAAGSFVSWLASEVGDGGRAVAGDKDDVASSSSPPFAFVQIIRRSKPLPLHWCNVVLAATLEVGAKDATSTRMAPILPTRRKTPDDVKSRHIYIVMEA